MTRLPQRSIQRRCRKPVFACGASTVSPLFPIIDSVQGIASPALRVSPCRVLLLDEGDSVFSDERAENVKILNNGNARGLPVLRSEVTNPLKR